MFLMSISFILLSALISLLLIKNRGVFFVFRAIGIILSLIAVGSFVLNYFNIKLYLQNYLIFFAGILLAVYLFDYLKHNKISSPVDEIKKFKFEKHISILVVISFAVSVFISFLYFENKFDIPRYMSIDASYHFLLGKYVNENNQLLFFNKDLYFKDPINYPFGTSIITSLFSSLLFFIPYVKTYNLLNIFFYAAVTAYFFLVAYQKIKLRTKTAVFLFIFLNCLGFFFNLMAFGFFSQLVGLFLLIFFIDLYPEIKNTTSGSVLAGIILSALFFTYIYWFPVAILFMLLKNIDAKNIKNYVLNKKNILNLSASALTFLVIAAPYLIALYNFNVLGFISDNGGTYKTFFLNFFMLAPFMVLGLFDLTRSWAKENNSVAAFFISGFFFSFILYILYLSGVASQYALAKSYYLLGPILYYAGAIGIESVFLKLKSTDKDGPDNKSFWYGLKNEKFPYIFGITLISIIALVILIPFFKNDDKFDLKNSPSLKMNTWKLNGNIFDVFYFNSQLIRKNSEKTNRIKLSQRHLLFFSNVRKHMPSDDLTKTMVIANPDYSLWFYAMTWVWPRTSIDGSESIWRKLPDYNTWLAQRSSDTLILLDTPETREWIKDSAFNFDNFEVLYKEGKNYILRLKNSDRS